MLVVLGGCGGDTKPTRAEGRESRINDPVRRESVNASIGDLRLLSVRIAPPVGSHEKGSTSGLFLTLANHGPEDRLVAVSTVDARSVVQRTGAEPPEVHVSIDVARNGTVSMQHADGLHL